MWMIMVTGGMGLAQAQDNPLQETGPEDRDRLPTAESPAPDAISPETPTSESLDDNSVVPAFGSRGQDRWYFHGSGATTLDDDQARRFGMVGAGLSHFFVNGHSINLELNGFFFDQTGQDAAGINLNAMMRWHFVREEDWSLYVDGGAGLLGTTSAVPNAGSQFNFTPQVGGGATVRLSDEQRLMMGVRWHHISNADLYSPNPGRDSIQGYMGLNLPR